MYCRDLPSSERYLLAALHLDPSYQRAHRLVEAVYLYQRRYSDFLEFVDNSSRNDAEKAEIRRVFAHGGDAAYRQWELQRALRDPTQNQRYINLASAYAFTGDRDHALYYLQKAYEQGDPRLKFIRAYPQYWFLYGDADYNALLKKIGLPETIK